MCKVQHAEQGWIMGRNVFVQAFRDIEVRKCGGRDPPSVINCSDFGNPRDVAASAFNCRLFSNLFYAHAHTRLVT